MKEIDIENEMNKASIEVTEGLYRLVLDSQSNDFVNLFRIRIAKIWCEQIEKEAIEHIDDDVVSASDELMKSITLLKDREGRDIIRKVKGEEDLHKMYR